MVVQQMLLAATPPDTTPRYKVTQDSTSGHGSYIDLGADLITSTYLTYTVEAWVRPLVDPSTNGQAWIIDQHPSGSGRTFIGANNGNLAWFSGNMYETSTSFGSTSSFAHLAFVANGDGTVTIFKDGTSAGTSGSGFITIADADGGDYYSASQDTPHYANITVIIPNNIYYKLVHVGGTDTLTVQSWVELR